MIVTGVFEPTFNYETVVEQLRKSCRDTLLELQLVWMLEKLLLKGYLARRNECTKTSEGKDLYSFQDLCRNATTLGLSLSVISRLENYRHMFVHQGVASCSKILTKMIEECQPELTALAKAVYVELCFHKRLQL